MEPKDKEKKKTDGVGSRAVSGPRAKSSNTPDLIVKLCQNRNNNIIIFPIPFRYSFVYKYK
jgi:hypothetical protein